MGENGREAFTEGYSHLLLSDLSAVMQDIPHMTVVYDDSKHIRLETRFLLTVLAKLGVNVIVSNRLAALLSEEIERRESARRETVQQKNSAREGATGEEDHHAESISQ